MKQDKQRFITVFKENIKRDGADKLLDYLEKSDFFTAPSSTRFHGNYVGGLCEHSLNVYDSLVKLVAQYKEQFPDYQVDNESIAIVSLLHDLCKVNLYETTYRNVKDETTNQWYKKTVYVANEKLGMGHGEGSLYIVQSMMKLHRDEALAIRHHMGAWDATVQGGSTSYYNSAQAQTPLVLLTHMADNWASTFMEETVD